MEEPLVSFIVGNYNGESIIGECLEAILAQDAAPLEVIVVDDASSDASARAVGEYPSVRLLVNEVNRGLAVCRNRGLEAARGRYVAFIDNDAVLEPGWLAKMLGAVEEWPEARLFASHLVFYDDPGMINSTGGFINLAGHAWDRSMYRDEKEVLDSPYILYPCGAAMFMTSDLPGELGGFDPAYRYSYDDVELGWRTLMLGHQVIYVAGARARHRLNYTVGRRNTRKRYQYERNRIRALVKNLESPILRSVAPNVASLFLHRVWVELTGTEYGLLVRLRYVARMLQALAWNLAHLRGALKERRKTASLRVVSDQELINAGLIYNAVDMPSVTAAPLLIDHAPSGSVGSHHTKNDLRMVKRDAGFLGEGWHVQERTSKGVRFRWTDCEAVAVLANSGQPKRLIIETLLANPHEESWVDVELNGRPAGSLLVANRPAKHELKISPEAANGQLEVRLLVRNPFNPAKHIGGEDHRTLGIAVTRIAVR